MGNDPPAGQEEQIVIGCPYCTIQVPADATVCPYCRNALPAAESGGAKPEVKARSSFKLPPSRFWQRYEIVLKAGGPVLLAVVVLLLVYRSWTGYRIEVVPNPDLPLQVETTKQGHTVVLRGTMTNKGPDVPDLSLRSIRVIVEFLYRDGRRDRKIAFPQNPFRGKGALLRGETGTFEVAASSDRLETIFVRSEVVNLDLGKKLIPSRERRAPVRRR